mmetsp:Transcript_7003/g.7997  ORF Transcript_7003/g.7997 Transcript_7003/m.7997 type:complete len:143 (-) Transcript_7003:818-1246(-)
MFSTTLKTSRRAPSEVAFLFPWAMSLRDLEMFGFRTMMLFLLISTVGFMYDSLKLRALGNVWIADFLSLVLNAPPSPSPSPSSPPSPLRSPSLYCTPSRQHQHRSSHSIPSPSQLPHHRNPPQAPPSPPPHCRRPPTPASCL